MIRNEIATDGPNSKIGIDLMIHLRYNDDLSLALAHAFQGKASIDKNQIGLGIGYLNQSLVRHFTVCRVTLIDD